MIVDDDPRLSAALQFRLEQAGYEVHSARSGRDFFGQLEMLRPDLILLDLMMPDMSGLEVLEYLQSDPDLSGIPVLVVTAWGHAAVQSRCLELGAKGFFSKPFSLRALAVTVDEHLA
jgi:DNA-binding response OmpR family regulator